MRITTGMLNSVLADATARVQPPTDKGRRLKIYYMTQVGIKPPHFVVLLQRRPAVPLLLSAVSGEPDPRHLRPGGHAGAADHPAEGRQGGVRDADGTASGLSSCMALPLCIAAIAYFCGCFNGAVIVSKYILRDDVRNHGSGNAGLTNFYRTFGGPLTLVVILTDVLKAVVAVLIGVWIAGHPPVCGAREPGWCYGEILGRPVLPAGPHVPLHVPLQGGQGHPVRRHHRHHDRLAHCPGGVGRLPDPGHSHPICLPGLRAGPGPASPWPPGSSIRTGSSPCWACSWAAWWSTCTGATSTVC